MSKKTTEQATVASVPTETTVPDPFAHVGDPSWGKGGSYEVDLSTGQRRLVVAPHTAETKSADQE